MSKLFLYLFVFAGGIAAAVQPCINGSLARKTGTLESALVSFIVGTFALIIVVLLAGRGTLRGVHEASLWELSGGFLGAFFVFSVTYVVPRIGTMAAMAVIIAGQLIAGAVIDHYGFFDFKAVPLDFKRIAAIVFLLAGAFLAS